MNSILNEHPRLQLEFIVTKFGHGIFEDENLLEAMLWDLCPEHQREVRLLVMAIKEKIAEDLLNPRIEVSLELRIERLSRRLYDSWGITEELAKWAVESVALALNIMQADGKETTALPGDIKQIGKFMVQNGIATDIETGLTWLRFSYGQAWKGDEVIGEVRKANWKVVSNVIKSFNQQGGYAGFTDWRLPAVDELKSLIDKVKGKEGHCIDVEVFPSHFFWFWCFYSGMGAAQDPWVVNFSNGTDNYSGEYNGYAIRLVRGRQQVLRSV